MKLSLSLPLLVSLWGSSSMVVANPKDPYNKTRASGLRATAKKDPQPTTTKRKLQDHNVRPFNNIGYAVKGYDIILGEPLDTSGLTTVDPGFRQPIFGHDVDDYGLLLDLQYLTPSGITAVECEGCNMAFSTEVMDSMEKFQESMAKKVEVRAEASGPGFRGQFSASRAVREAREHMMERHETSTMSEISCCVYQAELEAFNMPPHTQGFLAAVQQMSEAAEREQIEDGQRRRLPMFTNRVNYDSTTFYAPDLRPIPKSHPQCSALNHVFDKFVREFGTHYVKKVTMGSLYGEQTFISTSTVHEMEEESIDIEMAASFSASFRLQNSGGSRCGTCANSRPSARSGNINTSRNGGNSWPTSQSSTTNRDTTTQTQTQTQTQTEGTCAGSLMWSDEFDGTSLDASKWAFTVGNGCDISWNMCGWGNNERAFYTTGTANTEVSQGTLKIKTMQQTIEDGGYRTDYTSARINTHGLMDFDLTSELRIEARIQVPRNSVGLWSAFWMMPSTMDITAWPTGGEIDIMEFRGNETSKVHGTVHYGRRYNDKGQHTADTTLAEHVGDNFHVFSVEKRANKVSWFVDGELFTEVTSADIGSDYPWPFENQFYIILNLAVGGGWAGEPDPNTQFPNQMEIDYVRVSDISSCTSTDQTHGEQGARRRLPLASASGSAEFSSDYDVQKTQQFSDSVNKRSVYSRGAKPPADGDIGQWLGESSDNPVPTHLELEPLVSLDIFQERTDPFLTDCLTEYFGGYCERINRLRNNSGGCSMDGRATISTEERASQFDLGDSRFSNGRNIEQEHSITPIAERGEWSITEEAGWRNNEMELDASGREVFNGLYSQLDPDDRHDMVFESVRASFPEGTSRIQDPVVNALDPDSADQDDWYGWSEDDASFTKVCPANHAITKIVTRRAGNNRIFRIECSEFIGKEISERGWAMDEWDRDDDNGNIRLSRSFDHSVRIQSPAIDYRCPINHVLIGIKSDIDETSRRYSLLSREWSFLCGMVHIAYEPNKESITPSWNELEEHFEYEAQHHSVLIGLNGDFDRSTHDTRFQFVERALPENTLTTGLYLSAWFTETTESGIGECEPGTAVTGIRSRYRRHLETNEMRREYRLICRSIPRHNLIHSNGETARVGLSFEDADNADWSPWQGGGSSFGLVCPDGKVLAGVQTQWDETVTDMKWKIMCLATNDVSE